MSTAAIPLAIQAPNITPPLQLEQQAEQLRAMQQEHGVRAQEMDLRDQQIKAAKLQNTLNEQLVAGTKRIQDIFATPDPAFQPLLDSEKEKSQTPAAPAPEPSTSAAPQPMPSAVGIGLNSAMALGQPNQSNQPNQPGQASALPAPAPPTATQPQQAAARPFTMPSTSATGALDSRMQRIWEDPTIPYTLKVQSTQQMLTTQKEIANNVKLNRENVTAQNNRYVGIIDGVIQGASQAQSPAAAEAIYQNGLAQAHAEGLPGTESLPAHFPGIETLVQQRNLHMLHTDLLTDADKSVELRPKALAVAGQTIGAIAQSQDPASAYQDWRRHQDWRIQPELPQQWSPEVPGIVQKMGLNVEQQIKAPGEAAKAQGEVDANNARILGSATGLLDYARKYDKLPDDQKASFRKPEDIEARGGWNKDVAKQILQVGETPSARQQRETAEMNAETARKREEQYATRTNMLENKAEDARKGQMKETTYWNLVKQHNDMEQKKNDLWRKNLEYGEIVDRSGYSDDPKDTQHKQPDGSMITDPETGRDVALTGERFKRFKGMQQKTKADAEAMEKDMKQIQQRLHGGEFADINQNTPSTTAATKTAPPTKVSPRSVQKFSLPNGKVRIMVDGKSYEGTPDQADQLATKMNWTFGEKNQGK